MHNTIIEKPLIEPVSLEEAKTFLRVDSHQENALIESLIKVARRLVEDFTSKALITQTHRVIAGFDEVQNGAIVLPVGPFQNIASKPKVLSKASAETIHNFRVDISRPQARIYLGHQFSSELSVQIDYRCGYGEQADDVPEPLRQGILLVVADLYENRPGENSGKLGIQALPGLVRNLLDPYRILHLN